MRTPNLNGVLKKSGFLTQNNFYKILCYVNVNIQTLNLKTKFI